MITEEEIDVLGNMLEDKGMSHSDIDAYFLEHFGVKGMRWGVRQNKAKTGLARRHAALIESDARNIKLRKKIRDRKAGTVLNAITAADRLIMGKKRFEKFHNMHIKNLQNRQKRVRSGELLIRDRLAANLGISPINMLIVRKS
jgi:hypothetical protein